jgi:hypothetical protein
MLCPSFAKPLSKNKNPYPELRNGVVVVDIHFVLCLRFFCTDSIIGGNDDSIWNVIGSSDFFEHHFLKWRPPVPAWPFLFNNKGIRPTESHEVSYSPSKA